MSRGFAKSSASARVAGGVWLAITAGLSLTRAELEWHDKRLLLEPPVGASDAYGQFEFINRGTRPVKITDVKSGCGCTVAALDQDVVQPGEKGRVRATYHVGDRQGHQSVAVTVTTQEPEARSYDLVLEVAIKEFVTMTPRLLYWRIGDEPEPKILRLTLASGFQFVGAESKTRDFSAEVAAREANTVELKITPRDLWAKRNGAITVKVAQPGKAPVEVSAVVRVM